MSWKSLVTAGLLCVLASSAYAVPQLEIAFGGLNASGDYVWNVRIAPTAAGTPMDAELALSETGSHAIASVANAAPAIWDTNVAGNGPASFAWLVNYGTPAKPEGLEANCPTCTVTNTAASGGNAVTNVNAALDQIFAALGSKDLVAGDLTASPTGNLANSTGFLTITVKGPTDGASSTALSLLGSYDGNTSGHISEITSGTNSSNYKGFSGSTTRTLVSGDADLSGVGAAGVAAVDISDLTILATNLNKPAGGAYHWNHGDFDGTTDGVANEVDISDLTILASHLNNSAQNGVYTKIGTNGVLSGVLDTPGAGSGLGAGSAVPEPASIALMGLALLGGLGLVGRKR